MPTVIGILLLCYYKFTIKLFNIIIGTFAPNRIYQIFVSSSLSRTYSSQTSRYDFPPFHYEKSTRSDGYLYIINQVYFGKVFQIVNLK